MPYNNFFPIGYQSYPQAYQPPTQAQVQQQLQTQTQQNNQSGILWVQGIEGAKAHPVAPGQAVLLMDSDSDCLYLKSADVTGMPSLRVFDYKERINVPQKAINEPVGDFATKDDISALVTKDELKKAISDLKKDIKKEKKDE